MTLRRQHAVVLLVVGLVLLAALVWPTDPGVPLVPVVEGPRPPVKADPATQPIVMEGLEDHFVVEGRALRESRNALARRHAEAVEAWRSEGGSLRDAERVEQMLWVARHAIGEIDARRMNTELAELFAREARRLEQLQDSGHASDDDVERAWLAVALARHRAGLPEDEGLPDDYPARRQRYLERWRRVHDALVENRLAPREQVELEWRALQGAYPPVETP